MNILATYINGKLVSENKKSKIESVPISPINHFNTDQKSPSDFAVPLKGNQIAVIQALDGEIITKSFTTSINGEGGFAAINLMRDILKITVVNRYQNAPPAVAFINGFGLQQGALASCVGHDSHNIIAVGTSDDAIARAVNLVIKHKGGISAVSEDREAILPLPVAGIMSDNNAYLVGEKYAELDKMAKKELGCILNAPYMTLSFMALLVIPRVKIKR